MSQLIARIISSEKTALFWGSGTFQAKDQIKELGPAIWLREKKMWQVKPFELSKEELLSVFPSLEFDENDPAPVVEKRSKQEKEEAPANACSVSELVSRAQYALKKAFPGTICVYGVLSKVKEAAGGRVFLDLVDAENEKESINCVIWAGVEELCKGLKQAGFNLEPELQVMFKVQVNLNRRDSRISLKIVEIVAEYTIAKVAAKRELTNKKLKEEGLFDKNKELELPFLPKRLGILTSSAGTVINDFRASLDQANFGFELFWLDVSVQGQTAKKELIQGIRKLSKMKGLDAILIFRGGGSPADLAVFSEYEVAREVCLARVPVVSAVGHQEDQSSVQDVSNVALGVPKDIGRFFADKVLQMKENLFRFSEAIYKESHRILLDREEDVVRLASSLPLMTSSLISSHLLRLSDLAKPLYALSKNTLTAKFSLLESQLRLIHSSVNAICLENLHKLGNYTKLPWYAGNILEKSTDRVSSLEERIKDASPEVQLKRGFTLVRNQEEQLVMKPDNLESGELVEIEFYNNKKKARID